MIKDMKLIGCAALAASTLSAQSFSAPQALATPAGVHRELAHNAQTLTGLDVLEQEKFQPLQGKRIGLITNQTGRDRAGRRNVDVMLEAGVRVAAWFAPEHSFDGTLDLEKIPNSADPKTGIHIFSLYGASMRPTAASLRGLDALVFDIQDVGARFYTYQTTMFLCMEEAAKAHIQFYVLDRPNPITGTHVEGPLLDPALRSNIGHFAGLPVRHGMTMGELARMFNAETSLGADLTVIPLEDWHRGDWFDATGLAWVNPSPNMRSLNAATLYPGLALLEYSKGYSVGRGTDAPFEQVGAAFIGGRELAAYLNEREIPGARVYPTMVGKVEGVRFVITNRELFDATRLGLEVAAAIQKLYPGKLNFSADGKLIGSEGVVRRLMAGEDPRSIQQSLADQVDGFVKKRAPYLLYR